MGTGAPARMLSEAMKGATEADVQTAITGLSKEDRAMLKSAIAKEDEKDSALEAGEAKTTHAPLEAASASTNRADMETDDVSKVLPLASIGVTSLAGERRMIDGISPGDTLTTLRSKVMQAFDVEGASHVELVKGAHQFTSEESDMSLEMLGIWNAEGSEELSFVISPKVRMEDFKAWHDKGVHVTHLPTKTTCSLQDTRVDYEDSSYHEDTYNKPEIELEETDDPGMPRVAFKYVHYHRVWEIPPRHINHSLKTINSTEKTCYIVLRKGKISISSFGKDHRESRWALDENM